MGDDSCERPAFLLPRLNSFAGPPALEKLLARHPGAEDDGSPICSMRPLKDGGMAAGGLGSVLATSAPVNLDRIDLSSLRLVVACATAGSLTHAAPMCHMSTMNASRRLKLLEESLGVALFYRRKSGLELTAAGQVVAQESARLLQMLEAMVLSALRAPRPMGEIYENPGRARRRLAQSSPSLISAG